MNFARGQEAKLADLTPATDLTVGLDVRATGSPPVFDISCFGVDAENKLLDDRYFVFYNQKQSPDGEIRQLGPVGGDSEAFGVDLARLPQEIRRLVFTVTLDGAGTMSQVFRGHLRISAGGSEVARFTFSGSDLVKERTLIAGELYREGEWRFAAVGQGFDGGLSALLEYFGGEEVAQDAPEPAAAPRAQGPPTQIRDDLPPLDKPAKEESTGRNMPKWERAARNRLTAAIERYSQPLAALLHRDANEGDTRLLITDLLCDGFGFDKFEDLTTEYRIRGRYVDYGLRIDRNLVALMEVKRIAMNLAARHLLQAQNYALNEGVEWVLLTNGARWQAYRVTASMPIQVDLTLDVDLLGPGTPAEKAEELFYLTRESLKKGQIDELWKARRATAPGSLAEVLVSEPVITAIRRELRRKTGHKTDDAEISRLLRETVIKGECFN